METPRENAAGYRLVHSNAFVHVCRIAKERLTILATKFVVALGAATSLRIND